MQLKSSRSGSPLWRKLFVALMTVALAIPFFSLPADAASADRMTVKFTAPKPGDKVSGFVNTSFNINPRGTLGVPAKRQDTPYRAYSLSYAQGADVRDDGSFSVWRIDGGTNSQGPGKGVGARDSRNVYVQPGVGSVRPPRAGSGGFPWDSTLLADGPATLRLRGFGYDGSFKDDYLNLVVENKGVTPDYTEMIAPKNGDTVKGWVPVTFTAMPQWQGIQLGKRDTRYATYLPSCLDTDLNYSKVEYATGSSPGDTDWILWWYNSAAATRIKEQIPTNGRVQVGVNSCDSMYINRGGTNWDSTAVPDGPASIRVTVIFTDGSYRTFDRVVNVDNKGAGVQYFGFDKSGTFPTTVSGEGVTLPGYANVPQRGLARWVYELPVAYIACDIAAGDVSKNPDEADWTMFYVNDNITWNEIRTPDGWVIGGDTRLPDWSVPGWGRSGAICNRLDSTAVPNGVYTVQLRLQRTDGVVQRDWAVVTVKN